MPFALKLRARSLLTRILRDAASSSLLLHQRRRRHLAILSVALLVSVFGYILLQPRKVRVQADGRDTLVETRMSNDAAVLRGAGISLNPGDRVTALVGSDADVLRVDRAHTVRLIADRMTYELRTHAVTIDQLLAEADVAIGDRDSVVQNGELVSPNAPVEPPRIFATRRTFGDPTPGGDITIEVRRAVPFTIVDDGRAMLSTSSRPTIAQALREAGMVIGPGDSVVPGEQSPLVADTRVEVRHAKAVTITLPDDHRVLYTLASTVGDALAAAGIVLPQGAFIDPPSSTPITAGMSVRVVQLSESDDVAREYVESATVYRPDSSLGPGKTRVVKGHDGVRVRRYSVSYVNGREAGRELIEEYDDPESLDTVIYYSADTGRNDTAPPSASGGARILRVYATWYNPASSGRSPSDPSYGRTATGAVVTYGIVAVDPNVIPLGTRMYIPGYGYAVAADTGGAVKGYIIDLGFPDGVAVDWRSKWVDIQILS